MWVIADVTFDTDAEAREAERLVREGKLAGVSVDLGEVTSELEILDVDDDGFPTDWLETVTAAEIIAATQVAMPAFADARLDVTADGVIARLVPEGVQTSDRRIIQSGALTWRDPAPLMFNDTSDGHSGATFVGNLTNFRRESNLALVASGNPNLGGLTRPKVFGGKITGHGAGWGTCHTAFQSTCVTPPSCSYAHVKEGVGVYRHPRGDVHAPLGLGLDEAKRWYDAHCELVAVGEVGEDVHGIWVDGPATLPDGEVFLSGDWRDDGGQLELISFLVVDNPGFPTAMVASEHQTALTAAGIVTATDSLVERITRLERLVASQALDVEVERLERVFSEIRT